MSNTTSIKVLLTLVGIGAIIASIFLVVKPKNESIKALQSNIAELQARYDDLVAKEANKDQYIKETEEFNKQFQEEVVKYAPDLDQENTLMFLKSIEEDFVFQNVSVSLPKPSVYYTLGGEDASEAEEGSDEPYVVLSDQYSISYKGSYEELKRYMDHIANYKYRMAISSINIAYSADAEDPLDECTGSIALNEFAITGPDRTAEVPSITVDEGKEVIFEDINGGSRASVSYDDNNGSSIVSNHNLVILLNNAGSDTSSGIIVASDESSEGTYVTSSANSVENLSIKITTDAGKNYIEYSIGSNSSKTEILSKDVTIYVKSSARVGSDDTNGVNVAIDNSSELSVYIKVADDDSSNPRFTLGSKTGTVKVY